MTATQVMRFLENDDSTAIHFRQFNLSPKDKYPAFSICFTGSELYWNQAEEIFKATQLSPPMLKAMLRGQDAFSYHYNHTLKLYDKIPVDIGDYPNMDIGRFSVKVSDIVTGLEYGTDEEKTSVSHGIGEIGNRLDDIPLEVGHESSDTVCYTRGHSESLETLRTYDWLEFNNSIFGNEKYTA